jgi:hypothetical protein
MKRKSADKYIIDFGKKSKIANIKNMNSRSKSKSANSKSNSKLLKPIFESKPQIS